MPASTPIFFILPTRNSNASPSYPSIAIFRILPQEPSM
uniref:Uncharacterized protein n=1 Tax=Rhizophora mucronata TaxID=61149 RepID=A0A2P2PEV6_RHIMU